MRAQASDEASAEVSSGVKDDFLVDEGQMAELIRNGKSMGVEAWQKELGARNGHGCCDCWPRRSLCCGWRVGLKQLMLSEPMGNASTGFVVFNLVMTLDEMEPVLMHVHMDCAAS